MTEEYLAEAKLFLPISIMRIVAGTAAVKLAQAEDAAMRAVMQVAAALRKTARIMAA